MSKLDQLRALREARFEESKAPKRAKSSRGEAGNSKQPLMASRPAPPVPREAKPAKRGRGRPKVTGKRPWELEGVSRRTWYRRQAEKKGRG